MGYAEQPGDVARVWYVRRHEDGQRKEGHWYCDTKLEARVLLGRLVDDEVILETAMDAKYGDTWREEN